MGTLVYAVAPGKVIVAGDDSEKAYGPQRDFYGRLVIIELSQRLDNKPVYCLYGHLDQVLVEEGQVVDSGDEVGRIGMTGVALGPHLHFEVRVGANRYDETRNPELWLRPKPGSGIIAGRLLDAQNQPVPEHTIVIYRAETPDRRWSEVTTYAIGDINSDDEWKENFARGDVPAGDYILKTTIE